MYFEKNQIITFIGLFYVIDLVNYQEISKITGITEFLIIFEFQRQLYGIKAISEEFEELVKFL